MMQGLCLDAAAPLYGRAPEIIKVEPLDPTWIRKALPGRTEGELLEAYAVWGRVPRYWELARDSNSTSEAIRRHVLDPLGVLSNEPSRLLLDDMQEIAQASSILSLIGEGCHRISEIAGRIGKPATSLSRPLARLVDLGLVAREVPFGGPESGSKRSLYRISDPFLRFWFRFVLPHRSLAAARSWPALERDLRSFLPGHLGQVWEDLSRASVSRLEIGGSRWRPASRWWGPGIDHRRDGDRRRRRLRGRIEDPRRGGEAPRRPPRMAARPVRPPGEDRAVPLAQGREVVPCVWYVAGPRPPAGIAAVSARRVFLG